MTPEQRHDARDRILAHPIVQGLLAIERNATAERIAQAIEQAADDHNRKIAAIAGIEYDPDRHDGMQAAGIRQAARIAREIGRQ